MTTTGCTTWPSPAHRVHWYCGWSCPSWLLFATRLLRELVRDRPVGLVAQDDHHRGHLVHEADLDTPVHDRAERLVERLDLLVGQAVSEPDQHGVAGPGHGGDVRPDVHVDRLHLGHLLLPLSGDSTRLVHAVPVALPLQEQATPRRDRGALGEGPAHAGGTVLVLAGPVPARTSVSPDLLQPLGGDRGLVRLLLGRHQNVAIQTRSESARSYSSFHQELNSSSEVDASRSATSWSKVCGYGVIDRQRDSLILATICFTDSSKPTSWKFFQISET